MRNLVACVGCSLAFLAVALSAACGGSASTGGGGNAAGASPSATSCVGGSITFKLLVAPGSTNTYCVATSSFSCGLTNWLSIRNADGTYLSQDAGRCVGSCDTCAQLACPNICETPDPIGPEGVDTTFDGFYFVPRTCGAGIACAGSGCAASGNYVAKLCGSAAGGGDAGLGCANAGFNAPLACVEVPFTWPPATSGATITGTIGGAAGEGP